MSDAIDWRGIHERLSALGQERARLDAEEARWLVAGKRAAVHRWLGFATYPEYLERTSSERWATRVATRRSGCAWLKRSSTCR
jgi:hypothetical protein